MLYTHCETYRLSFTHFSTFSCSLFQLTCRRSAVELTGNSAKRRAGSSLKVHTAVLVFTADLSRFCLTGCR